ncbi:MAG: HD domain-containing protein [Anaerolineales bacterium]|nr:HD domain-containing protein [Anaerolineales bacterium]
MDSDEALPNLPRLEWVQTIPDPIWREIPITQVERHIIQTNAFQRLRGIKQLGFAYLTFPGATHTRFEHSLGVMHATDMLLKMVKKDECKSVVLIPMARQILRLAALLHDIGHPPFSHAMENLFTYYPDIITDKFYQGLPDTFSEFLRSRKIDSKEIHKHELFTEYIICRDPGIRPILCEWLSSSLKGHYAKEDLEYRVNSMIDDGISRLACGKEIVADKLPGNIASVMPLFRSIMNGDIDADKIDYLMRDNYYCGLPHNNDIDSLRDQLALDLNKGSLKIHRGALKFVHSLLLARYRLITEVHHEKWDIFATARVIELLHDRLVDESNLGPRIIEIFTRWIDYKLVDYLIEKESGRFLEQILTTQYALTDLARLEYLETHPSIRAGIDILADQDVNHHIPKLQEELRGLSGNPNLVVHVQTVKLPEFSMSLVDGGELLGDAILRGISEESVSALQLVVYGDGTLDIPNDRLEAADANLKPCENCKLKVKCIGNLVDGNKRLLAELAVHRYREIVKSCGKNQVTIIDFLMLVIEQVTKVCSEKGEHYPTRQSLYKIAKRLHASVSDKIRILGTLDFSEDHITSSFHQQLRKYEQLGLIAYTRDIRRLQSEDQSSIEVFRFDRRFHLSEYGKMWLEKIRSRFSCRIEEYEDYKNTWELLSQALKEQREYICNVLRDG